jgi:hypothetical protein
VSPTTVIASTDCPLCRHPLIEHELDADMCIRDCLLCSCPGTGLTGQPRRFESEALRRLDESREEQR